MTCSEAQDAVENDRDLCCTFWDFCFEVPSRITDISPVRAVINEVIEEARLVIILDGPT
jgi:hypothetical protein